MSEWVIKFHSLFVDSGHQGPYSPNKLCNHSLHIGIIILPHTDNIQSVATIDFKKISKKKHKKWGHQLSWLVIGDGNSTSVYNDPKYLIHSLTEMEPQTAITNQPEGSKEKW